MLLAVELEDGHQLFSTAQHCAELVLHVVEPCADVNSILVQSE